MNLTITIGAAESQEFYEPGDFFRLMETEGPVTVYFYKAGREIARSEGVQEGYSERFLTGTFDRVRIESATAQTVTFLSRLGNEVRTDTPPNGSVTVQNTEASPVPVFEPSRAMTQAQKTVTSASGQLLAAKSNRAYLFIQNNDTSGSIYVTVEGTDATTALGLRIGPLGAFEFQGVCPSGAIKAIGDIASNANVVVLEG